MNKKIFIAFCLVCVLSLLINAITSYLFTTQFFSAVHFRRTELYKIGQYERYLSYLKDAETGQRGFVITGDPNYLKPYTDSLSYFDSPDVKDFFINESQSAETDLAKKVVRIERLKHKKLKELADVIATRKERGFEEAKALVESDSGKKIMDRIRYLINLITTKKEKQLNLLDKNIKQTTQYTSLFLVGSNSIAAILTALCLFSIYRSTKKLESKEEELSAALQKLNNSLATREAILNSANYAIIAVDQNGLITSFNPAAEKILGYQMKEVIGLYTPIIFHDFREIESRSIALSKQLNRKILPSFDTFTLLAKRGVPDTNEWTYIRKDGSRFPVLLSVTAIKNTKDQIIGYVGIAYDITERKEIDQMKNELITITSHELRSPIAAIKGSLDLLSQSEFALSDQAKKILALGQKNCKQLVRLTGDILDIQKIEAGKTKFNFKRLDVSAFLSQVLQSNMIVAHQSHISLICQPIPSYWAVEADEDRLLQVANNLISNAIKYSPYGGKIEIGAQKMDSKIRFEIKDQGPGIPQGFQSKIFQKFARDTSSTSTDKKGVGLGLNIAKSIIEKHKGLINFQTSPQGTTFWFELPVSES